MKLLIVQDKGIGDLIFLTAVLPLIKKEYEIHVMTPYGELLADNPYVKEALKLTNPLPSGFDLYVNLWNDKKYRFPKNTIKPREFRNFTLHEIERYQIVLYPILETTSRDVKPELFLKKGEKRNRVGIMAGARITSKTWTDLNYQKLIDYLKPNYEIEYFSGDASTSLTEVAYKISQCKYFIGNDTGLIHIAAALDVPLITLYFNKVQNPLRWSPWGVRQLLVRSKTNCLKKCLSSECKTPICREELDFEAVTDAFEYLVQGKGFTSRAEALYPLAKHSLFILLFGGGQHEDNLRSDDISCTYLPKRASIFEIIKTIKEKNINIIHSYLKPGIKLKLSALIGSNYVPEYPIIIEEPERFISDPKELIGFYLKTIENITNESPIY